VVSNVMKGAPADTGGLKVGDAILSIDGRDARELGTTSVQYLAPGKAGTAVTGEVQSPGEAARKLTLNRVDPSTMMKR
jgi:C-terminal processing protease CtpA/Prc